MIYILVKEIGFCLPKVDFYFMIFGVFRLSLATDLNLIFFQNEPLFYSQKN